MMVESVLVHRKLLKIALQHLGFPIICPRAITSPNSDGNDREQENDIFCYEETLALVATLRSVLPEIEQLIAHHFLNEVSQWFSQRTS